MSSPDTEFLLKENAELKANLDKALKLTFKLIKNNRKLKKRSDKLLETVKAIRCARNTARAHGLK